MRRNDHARQTVVRHLGDLGCIDLAQVRVGGDDGERRIGARERKPLPLLLDPARARALGKPAGRRCLKSSARTQWRAQ